MPLRPVARVLTVLFVFATANTLAHAQTTGDIAEGFTPYQSFHGGDVDSVNLYNGNLILRIPLASYPQRGGALKVSYSFLVNTKSSHVVKTCTPVTPSNCTYFWSYNGGGVVEDDAVGIIEKVIQPIPQSTNRDSEFAIVTSDGAQHPMVPEDSTGQVTGDATGFWANSSTFTTAPAPTVIIDRNGVRNFITATNGVLREDPNGNQITIASNGILTDTMGRSLPYMPATSTSIPGSSTTNFSGCTGPLPIASATIWSLPGVSGGTLQIKFCQVSAPINIPAQAPASAVSGATEIATQSIVLPNGTAWTLAYNGYGVPSQVTLPTGGTISYTYSPTIPQAIYPSPAVASRTVNANDGTGPQTWQYGPTVTDPLGNDTVHIFTEFGAAENLSYFETETLYYQGSRTSGTLLKTVQTAYNVVSEGNQVFTGTGVVPTSVTTTWPNGQVTQTQSDYDAEGPGNVSYGNVIARREYDYGSGDVGSLLRTTTTNYLAFSNATYLTNNLVSLLSSVQITDGSGTQRELTTYGYDESSLASSGISTNHDSAPPDGTARGNRTSVHRWLNTTGANITSTATFLDTGELQTATDPLGNKTTTAYSSTYVGAFPTTVTNALNQATNVAYDFDTGLVTSSTDANSLTTSYTYDSMWRLATVTRPDGGVDSIAHQESSFPFTATLTRPINSSQNRVSTNVFDGLGRVTQSQLTSDPQGTVYTDTTYDALGRISTVSNPHRTCGTDTTSSCGTTTYSYDPLSRKTSEAYPDGSTLTTAYCGPSTLVTDPTGKWRRSRTDGLGRLVEVDEPNAVGASVASTGCPSSGEPIFVTSYSYDALGNLTQVVQNGSHTRTFTYDSLSRLLTSNNPETGQINYTYDSNGNVLTKTDARSIVTTYGYDALNRETARSYSNGDTGITTIYDQTACLGLSTCQNIGHPTSATDAAGSEAWSYQVDATNRRSVHVNQRTTTSSPSNIAKTSTYYFDLAGDVTQVVYPTGRTVNYSFDAAGRASTAVDGSNGITYAAGLQTGLPSGCSATATCYTPQGTPYAVSLGQTSSFTGLNLTNIYNTRLQPQEFKASSSAGNAMDISYSFVDPATSKNAGHVNQLANNLDSTRSQTFTYDQLNRITAAQTTSTYATSPAHCWGETYTLDAWANLQSIAATTNSSYTSCSEEGGFSATADGNNHSGALSYDVSGNTSSDGINSYVWNGESQLKSAGGVSYSYDGGGRRAAKVGSKLYWYGSGGEILSETDASGNTTADYIYFGGKRIAMVPNTALSNGGFEVGLQGWSYWGTGITAQLISTPSLCYSGNDCLQLSNSDSGQTGDSDNELIPVAIGQTISLSAWVYQQSGGSGAAYWQLAVFDANSSTTGIAYIMGSPSSSTGTWVNETASYTVPTWATCPCYAYIYAALNTTSQSDVARFDAATVNVSGDPNAGVLYYVSDELGTSRVITRNTGAVCYDADFYPYGGERPYTDYCPQPYKFEGKERDQETGNDDFGARYYSNRFGRWLSADWSAVPVAVPYATLANPQTLNLYSMVGDDPETSADLDGHTDVWDVVNFVVGAVNAFASDTVGGAGRQQQDTTAGKLGAAAGDAGATIFGGTEAVAGVGGVGTGVALTSTGEGAIVGVPLTVVSAAATAQGTVTATTGAANLGAAAGDAINGALQSSGSGQDTTRAARREAMRQEGIPTSQQPSSQTSTEAGRQYTYEVPKEGGGTQTKIVTNQLKDENHGPHVEAGAPKANGQTDPSGRLRHANPKIKVDFNQH